MNLLFSNRPHEKTVLIHSHPCTIFKFELFLKHHKIMRFFISITIWYMQFYCYLCNTCYIGYFHDILANNKILLFSLCTGKRFSKGSKITCKIGSNKIFHLAKYVVCCCCIFPFCRNGYSFPYVYNNTVCDNFVHSNNT